MASKIKNIIPPTNKNAIPIVILTPDLQQEIAV